MFSEKHSMCSFSAEFHHILPVFFFHRIGCDEYRAECSIFRLKNTTVPFKKIPTKSPIQPIFAMAQVPRIGSYGTVQCGYVRT